MIEQLTIEGHDSELFSFLDPEYVEQLRKHPAAGLGLWTCGQSEDGRLVSVTYWNGPGCMVFTARPAVILQDRWLRLAGGFTTDSQLIEVSALTLLRYLFVQGYLATIDHGWGWIKAADPRLERLGFIRGYPGHDHESLEWRNLRILYFDWALQSLELIQHKIELLQAEQPRKTSSTESGSGRVAESRRER